MRHHNPLLIRNCFWILTMHKAEISEKTSLKKCFWPSKSGFKLYKLQVTWQMYGILFLSHKPSSQYGPILTNFSWRFPLLYLILWIQLEWKSSHQIFWPTTFMLIEWNQRFERVSALLNFWVDFIVWITVLFTDAA